MADEDIDRIKARAKARAQAKFLAESEPEQKPRRTPMQMLREVPQDFQRDPFAFTGKWAAAVPEAAATMATGAVAEPIAGLAGMASSMLPGQQGAGARTVQSVRDALTYQPRGEYSQIPLAAIGAPFEWMNKGSEWLGGTVTDVAGPAAGTAARLLPDAMLTLGGLKMGQGAVRARAANLEKLKQAAEMRGAIPQAEAATAKAKAKLLAGGMNWDDLAPEVRNRISQFASDAKAFEAADPVSVARMARGASLPVPVKLTKGQASRDPVQLRAEENLAQTDAGRAIREAQQEQNRALIENLDSLRERAAPKSVTLEDVGRRMAQDKPKSEKRGIEGALSMAERQSMGKIDVLYDKARKAGEMEKTVDIKPLAEFLRTHENPGMVSFITSKLKALKLVDADEFGNIRPTHDITLNELEGIRRAASRVAGTSSDGTARFYAGQAVREIDRMIPESAGGEAYKAARAARKQHAMRFEEPKAIEQLLADKSRTDRKVALEDVWSKTVLGGSEADLKRVRDTLLNQKDRRVADAGRKAWRDIAGATLDYIKGEATKGVATDMSGTASVNAGAMKRALDKIGDKKLDMILGKSTADTVRSLMTVTQEVKTLPPYKGGSTTVPNVLSVLDKLIGKAGNVPIVGPVAGGLARMGQQAYKAGRAGAEVQDALANPLFPRNAGASGKIPLRSFQQK